MTYEVRVARTHMHGRPIRYVYRRSGGVRCTALLIFLHGFGVGGRVSGVAKYGPLQTQSCCPISMTIVCPICRGFCWWDMRSLFAFFDEIVAEHSLSSRDVCIAGMSMGAYVIWRMLAARPVTFGAIVIVSGSPRRILSSFGIIRVPSIDVRKLKNVCTPIWVVHGKLDIVAPVSDVKHAFTQLSSADNNLIIHSKLGHTGTMRIAFCDNKLYQWIVNVLSHRRNEAEAHRRPVERW